MKLDLHIPKALVHIGINKDNDGKTKLYVIKLLGITIFRKSIFYL